MRNKSVTLYLASPRGFCAGVDRAVQIVERALEENGAPVYVRHEIVHNRHVVDSLKSKGAVFVEELDEIPGNDHPVIFSAHGVPKSVPQDAQNREMFYIDATCPLVSKVHREAERHHKNGDLIILIGHKSHPEVIGTMGQLPDGTVILVEDVSDVQKLDIPAEQSLAYVTQTTLSVDDTADIIAALEARFPHIKGPHKEDICYATTNRQAAVRALAKKVDALFVIGAPNSSNSNRLVEAAKAHGCDQAWLIETANNIDWELIDQFSHFGITAGASAPELLVQETIAAFKEHYSDVKVEDVHITDENVSFKMPKVVARKNS